MCWLKQSWAFRWISQLFLEARCVTRPYLPFSGRRFYCETAWVNVVLHNALGTEAARTKLYYFLIGGLFHNALINVQHLGVSHWPLCKQNSLNRGFEKRKRKENRWKPGPAPEATGTDP